MVSQSANGFARLHRATQRDRSSCKTQEPRRVGARHPCPMRGRGGGTTDAHPGAKEILGMFDLVFVLATLSFFGLAAVYVRGCDRL